MTFGDVTAVAGLQVGGPAKAGDGASGAAAGGRRGRIGSVARNEESGALHLEPSTLGFFLSSEAASHGKNKTDPLQISRKLCIFSPLFTSRMQKKKKKILDTIGLYVWKGKRNRSGNHNTGPVGVIM